MHQRKKLIILFALLLIFLSTSGQIFSQEEPDDGMEISSQQAANLSNIVIFSDGDFDHGWIDISDVTDDPTIPGAGPGTSTFDGSAVVANGGNPGAYRETTHTITFGDRIYSGGLNTNAIYDPGDSGPIAAIDFSSTLLHPRGTGNTGWVLLIEQQGNLYFSTRELFGNSSWQSLQVSDLTEEEFETSAPGLPSNNEHPDFSANGAPITFGYVLTNRKLGPGTLTNSHGIDNWSVTIHRHQLFLPMITHFSDM